MKIMSARNARNHFGEILDAARREPVVVTKSDRPVDVMILAKDAAETIFSEFFIDPESGYDEWLFGKVSTTMARIAEGTTQLHEHCDAMAMLKDRLKTRMHITG